MSSIDRVRRATPRPSAAAVTVKSSGSRQSSLTISPGWGGLCILDISVTFAPLQRYGDRNADRYSIGMKIEWRILFSMWSERWPLPVVSSTRITSPAAMKRLSPSLAVIFTPASRLTMYCRRGAGCQVDVVLGLGLAKDDAGRRQFLRQFAAAPLLDPFDLDVAEMRFAVGVGVEIVDLHAIAP